ncbi:MAG: response regulator transcription factor [Candidatus Binatia bacterium]
MADRLLDSQSVAQKILIVEDNSDLSRLLAIYLNGNGYETLEASTSAEGLSKALTACPDLIITDLNLPDMNGVDATMKLKQDPATSGIPIVVLTAMGVGQWTAQALNAGAAKCLIKPISPPALVDTVRELLQSPSTLAER